MERTLLSVALDLDVALVLALAFGLAFGLAFALAFALAVIRDHGAYTTRLRDRGRAALQRRVSSPKSSWALAPDHSRISFPRFARPNRLQFLS